MGSDGNGSWSIRERVIAAFTAAMALWFVAAVATDVVRHAPARTAAPGPATRRPAPDMALTAFDGARVRLSDLRGRPTVVNFWASWCPPCRAEAPLLERTARAYAPRGVVFLGVNTSDDEAGAREFLAAYGVTYPNVYDGGHRAATAFAVTALPTTVFLDREGRIARTHAGAFLGDAGARSLARWIEDASR